MVKIGAHLRKLSQNYNRGTTFLDHSVYMRTECNRRLHLQTKGQSISQN